MIAATILPLLGADGDPPRAIELASMLALIVGAIMIAAGVPRLGFVADLISKPTMIGYMNGLAITILVGQLPKLFGFSIDADGFIDEARGFVTGSPTGRRCAAALGSCVRSRHDPRAEAGGCPGFPACSWPWCCRSRRDPVRPRSRTASRWSARCRRASRRSRCRGSGSPTCGCWSAARWGSRSSRWPTRSRPPRPSPPEPGRSSTAIRR